jgi:hypothetical protein
MKTWSFSGSSATFLWAHSLEERERERERNRENSHPTLVSVKLLEVWGIDNTKTESM